MGRGARDRIRRNYTRHAASDTALLHLLRAALGRHQALALLGRSDWPRPQLRGLRSRSIQDGALRNTAHPVGGGARARHDALAGDARGDTAAGHPRRNPADKQRLHIAAQRLLASLHHHDGGPYESLRTGLRDLLRLLRAGNPRCDNLPPHRPSLRALLALHGETPSRLRKGRTGRAQREHLQKQHEILLTA